MAGRQGQGQRTGTMLTILGFIITVVIGLAVTWILLTQRCPYLNVFTRPVALLVGLLLGWIITQWLGILTGFLQLLKSPEWLQGDLGERERLKKALESERFCGSLGKRLQALLDSWVQTSQPGPVLQLAAQQGRIGRLRVQGAAFGMILMAAPAAWLLREQLAVWGLVAAVGLTIGARLGLLGAQEEYTSNRFLARLPASIKGTGVSAGELGEILGRAIQEAFKEHIPQPEQMAESIRAGLVAAQDSSREQLSTLHSEFANSQNHLLDQWKQATQEAANSIQAAEKSVSDLAASLTSQFDKAISRLSESFQSQAVSLDKAVQQISKSMQDSASDNVDRIREALNAHSEQLKAASDQWSQQLQPVLEGHVGKVQQSTEVLAAQLDKIGELEKDIQKVLHIQEAVDGTLKSVTSTEEFSSLIGALRSHLEASDELLKEAAKPRTIRLVELENGATEEKAEG